MIYQVPYRLSQRSLAWAKDISKITHLRYIPRSEYLPLASVAQAFKCPISKLLTILDTATRIHAIQFQDSHILIHPDGLAQELKTYAANFLKPTLKNLPTT